MKTNVQINIQFEETNSYLMEPHMPGCDCRTCIMMNEYDMCFNQEEADNVIDKFKITQDEIDAFIDSFEMTARSLKHILESADERVEDITEDDIPF